MNAWSLQWEKWEGDDFWMYIGWTRRDAINYAIKQWFSADDVLAIGRSNCWRRLHRKGIRVVKVKMVRA